MREPICAHSQRHRLTGLHARGFYVNRESRANLTIAYSVNEEVHTVGLACNGGHGREHTPSRLILAALPCPLRGTGRV